MWVERVVVRSATFPSRDCYPFDLPCLHSDPELTFHSPIAFFVGENGSGKSTLLEAIVRRADIPIWMRDKSHIAHGNPYETRLFEHVDLEWTGRRMSGSFFSAETFRDRAEFLDDVSLVDPGQLKYFGGRIILNQSHGEGMLTFFQGRYALPGFYLLDEPESALSPRSQLELARMLIAYAGAGHAQFVVATHSPILLAVPGAQLFGFTREGIEETTYTETEHYRLYRDFMAAPQDFLAVDTTAAPEGLPPAG
jgi:predicted ATPase